MSDRTCSADECIRPAVARGFCLKHYKRYMKYGDPAVVVQDGTTHEQCLVCGNDNPHNRRKYCSPECGKAAQRAQIDRWNEDHPEERKAATKRSGIRRRRTRHNLPVDFDIPKACDICGVETEVHVDHDHRCCPGKYSCGKCVGGFLCNNCNNGLGRFNDDPELLRAAAAYLERARVT